MEIPEDFIEFLHWVKNRTESYWANYEIKKDDTPADTWFIGAKWTGLTNEQIDIVEQKFNIRFTTYHRAFLQILHSVDKFEITEYTETFEENAPILYQHTPFFYDWIRDENLLEEIINNPYKHILDDVLKNRCWLKSWGNKPDNAIDKKQIFDEWYNNAPQLIPIHGHRFVVNDKNSPVFSVVGSDTIDVGGTLKSHLLNYVGFLFFDEQVELEYDEEDEQWYEKPNEEYSERFKQDQIYANNNPIPYWEELIYSNSPNYGEYVKSFGK
jgi:hypothetical protein